MVDRAQIAELILTMREISRELAELRKRLRRVEFAFVFAAGAFLAQLGPSLIRFFV